MSNVVLLRSDTPHVSQAVDALIQPKHILDYTDEEIDAHLEMIRSRRMLKFSIYQSTMQKKDLAERAKVAEKLEKKGAQFVKQMAAVDKAFDKMELILNEIRGLRLQMGINPDGDE